MPKKFRYLNQEWEVIETGTGRGVGSGRADNTLPGIDRWSVIFRSASHPERGEYRASISVSNAANATEEELKSVLDEQLVIGAINRSRYIWRPAEAIAAETGLEIDRVRDILENTADDVIAGDNNQQGLLLYTTGEHLANTSGDVLKKVYDVEESS